MQKHIKSAIKRTLKPITSGKPKQCGVGTVSTEKDWPDNHPEGLRLDPSRIPQKGGVGVGAVSMGRDQPGNHPEGLRLDPKRIPQKGKTIGTRKEES